MAVERLTAIEVVDEDGNAQIFQIKRFIVADIQDPNSVFSREITFRPGGMAVATPFENRNITTIDDGLRDAQEREGRELAHLRERGMSTARTGGEEGIAPDEARVPARRGRRKPATVPANEGGGSNDGAPAAGSGTTPPAT